MRDFINSVKWAYQRVVRGYDDRVEWALDDYINPMVLAHLKAHIAFRKKEQSNSYPTCLSGKSDGEKNKKWDNVLNIMLDGFEELERQEVSSVTCQRNEDMVDRATKLMGRYYRNLWT